MRTQGSDVTPFLLAAIAEATNGESVATNVALLRQNAAIAGAVAVAAANQPW
ncbi:hypothetical protein CJ255_21380 [Candidatus Viridilinea mediisalina]|uniref:Uncharacterized protein n=1 Tax=Candidatus Viridilinea mediisalina TaxID=2024553 RepID=A0A2A6RDR0_9CHLR|nr:pseudouridine-5'-phosphate glycosidase [Candidatus Viridilinea mediisalina]PDV99634.1 hypothetical protein CJ255_21380 [Candidatus Viridilinea mediisalina]